MKKRSTWRRGVGILWRTAYGLPSTTFSLLWTPSSRITTRTLCSSIAMLLWTLLSNSLILSHPIFPPCWRTRMLAYHACTSLRKVNASLPVTTHTTSLQTKKSSTLLRSWWQRDSLGVSLGLYWRATAVSKTIKSIRWSPINTCRRRLTKWRMGSGLTYGRRASSQTSPGMSNTPETLMNSGTTILSSARSGFYGSRYMRSTFRTPPSSGLMNMGGASTMRWILSTGGGNGRWESPSQNFNATLRAVYSVLTEIWKILLDNRDTMVPIIFMYNAMHLMNFSIDKKAWPVYITIGNLSASARMATAIHSVLLVALLPIAIKIRDIPLSQ